MFLLDSLLMAPGKAVLFLFEEMAKKAQEEFLDDETVKQELQEIYAMLEAGKISEQDFQTREFRLVERLQQIALAKLQGMGSAGAPPAIDLVATEVTEASVPELQLAPANDAWQVALANDAWQVGPADERSQIEPMRKEPEPARTFVPAVEIAAAAPLVAPPAFDSAPEPVVHAYASAPAAPVPPPAPVTPSPRLTMPQVVESATRGLAALKLKVSSVTSVARSEDGWHVTVELLERRGVPDTSDLLGIYELRLDHGGNILQYERTRMRRRCDLSR